MLLQRAEKLQQGTGWTYELKLDGFRALAIKSGRVHLRSRNDKDFNAKYPAIVQALAAMPDETVIDGEVVALESGRPSFSALQNGSATAPLIYYVFDVMILAGTNVMINFPGWRHAPRGKKPRYPTISVATAGRRFPDGRQVAPRPR